MFLLVLVLLLLFFSFIEIRLLVFGQDRVVVPPGPVGSLSASATWPPGASPQTPRGLGRPPNFWRVGYRRPILPRTQSAKINAPQNNYKPENALNASRIVFVPSLIPEGVLVHSNAMAGRSPHAFRAVFCFPSAPESGGGSARRGKNRIIDAHGQQCYFLSPCGKSSKRAFRGVRRKTLPAFFSLTGFRVVTRPTACEPLRDHSPLRVEVVTKLSQWGN
jgi:hypothetical protein